MRSNGTVKDLSIISHAMGGFTGHLDNNVLFGWSVCCLGDLDGDGIAIDLAVGAPASGGVGAVWIMFLHQNGTVKGHQNISDTQGGFNGELITGGDFGRSVAYLGDIDFDGITDMAVGAPRDGAGTIWILFLQRNGTVKSQFKIGSN